MSLWRAPSAVVALTIVGGVVTPLAPVAAGQTPTTRSTTVAHSCTFQQPSAVFGTSQRTVVSPETVTVQFPATVAPGEVFTAVIQPGAMRTTDGKAGLLSYDVAFPPAPTSTPAPTSNLRAYLSGAPGAIDGAAQVNRIAASGQHQEFGPFARISGDTTAKLGHNSRDGDAIDRWAAGLTVSAQSTFQFPAVALKMRAQVGAGGSTVSVGLKGAGSATGSGTDGSVNTIQGAEQGGYTTGRTSYFFCSSSFSGALSSTYVDASRPRYIAQTTTEMTSAGTHVPRSNLTTTLSARVSSDDELMSRVKDGGALVRFDIRDLATDTVIASPTATINADGTASTPHTFPDIAGGETRDNYEVTANYTGRAEDIAASSSDPVSYTVGYNEINAGVALRSTNGALAGGSMPVTLAADLTMPSGRTFPANLSIQLYRNDVPHGSPVAITSGGSTKSITFPTDTLPQQPNTTTYRYRAEIVPLIINNLDRYAGQSAVSVAAIVTGTNPGSALPEGGEGSVSLEGFFRAPQRVWDWLTGSIGQAGNFSVGFTR